jgi:hypothetical protein
MSKYAQERQALQQEVETLKENDPQALADLEKELNLAIQGANRWTDNIFNCKSYLTKKRGMDKKDACKTLGITSAFDCKCCCSCLCNAILLKRNKRFFMYVSLHQPCRSSIFVFLVPSIQMRRTRSPNRGRLVVASQSVDGIRSKHSLNGRLISYASVNVCVCSSLYQHYHSRTRPVFSGLYTGTKESMKSI